MTDKQMPNGAGTDTPKIYLSRVQYWAFTSALIITEIVLLALFWEVTL